MRMHLKYKKNKSNKTINKIIIIIILLILSVIYVFKKINEKALPQLISYADIETKKVISLLINTTVTNTIANSINYDELFITTKDSNGNILSIDFNSKEVNRILDETSKVVENNINYLSKGDIDKLDKKSYSDDGVIYRLPSGVIFNNVLLNNIMPKIPVRIDLISNIFCRINTDIKSYGINNALMTVSINITASVKVLLPFVSDTVEISSDVPVIIKLIEGSVPSYYFDGYLGNVEK